MSTLNATCPICGKKYNHCFKCKKLSNWRSIADTEFHYQIAMILIEYREGVIDAVEATKSLDFIGIKSDKDMDDLLPAVARDLSKIISEGSKTKKK